MSSIKNYRMIKTLGEGTFAKVKCKIYLSSNSYRIKETSSHKSDKI